MRRITAGLLGSALLTALGVVVPAGPAPAAGALFRFSPTVASIGTNSLVAWFETQSKDCPPGSPEFAICEAVLVKARRVGGAGQLLGSEITVFATESNGEVQHTVSDLDVAA